MIHHRAYQPVRRVVRGGYFGFGTLQNRVAWAIGLPLLIIACLLLTYGHNRLAVCLNELNACDKSMEARGQHFQEGEGPCYNKYLFTCQAPRWARIIIGGILCSVGVVVCVSFCCCCAPWPKEEDDGGHDGTAAGGYYATPYAQSAVQETQPLVPGYSTHGPVHRAAPSATTHSAHGLELQQQASWPSSKSYQDSEGHGQPGPQSQLIPQPGSSLQSVNSRT